MRRLALYYSRLPESYQLATIDGDDSRLPESYQLTTEDAAGFGGGGAAAPPRRLPESYQLVPSTWRRRPAR